MKHSGETFAKTLWIHKEQDILVLKGLGWDSGHLDSIPGPVTISLCSHWEKKIVFFVPDFPLFLTNDNKIIAFLPQSSNFVYLDGKQLGGNKHVQAHNSRRSWSLHNNYWMKISKEKMTNVDSQPQYVL